MDELEDLEYLVELSEAMKEEDVALATLVVSNIVWDAVKKKTQK